MWWRWCYGGGVSSDNDVCFVDNESGFCCPIIINIVDAAVLSVSVATFLCFPVGMEAVQVSLLRYWHWY